MPFWTPSAMPLPRAFLKEIRPTLALAIPMTAGQVGQMLLGFSDNLMVGRVGVVPLASGAFALGVLNPLFVSGIGVVASVSVLAAKASGANQPREVGEVLRHGLLISLVTGLIMSMIVSLALGGLYHLGAPPEVVRQSRTFFLIVGWSLLPAMGWQCLKAYCEALSFPLMPMMTMLGGVVLNVLLSWILIYGHLGAPAMGLTGAGWATLIARTLLFFLLLALVLRSPKFKETLPVQWFAPLSTTQIRTQLALGGPVALQLLVEVGTFSVAAIMMGWLGAAPLAAHQIAISYAAMTFMFPLGIAIAVSVRTSQAVGAGEWGRVRPIGLSGVGMAIAVMGFFSVGYFLFGTRLVGVFVSDAATAALAAQLLVVTGIFQVFDGTQVVSMSALRGLTDVKVPTLISFVSYWIIAVPACYFLGFASRAGAVGIWSGLAFGLAFAAVALLARFFHKTRSDHAAAGVRDPDEAIGTETALPPAAL